MMITVIIHHLLHTYVSIDCNIEKIAELNVCEVQFGGNNKVPGY